MSNKEVLSPIPGNNNYENIHTESPSSYPIKNSPPEQVDLFNFVSTIKNKGPRETTTAQALSGMIGGDAGRQTLSTLIEFMNPKKK